MPINLNLNRPVTDISNRISSMRSRINPNGHALPSLRLRIGLILPGFSASEADWCIPVVLNLIRELARQHEVHVFTLRYPHTSGIYQVYGTTVHAFGGGLAKGLERLPLLGKALISIIREARRQPFDLLHGLWADEPGFLAVTAGRLLKKPAVVSLLGGELVGLTDISYGSQLSRLNRHLVRMALAGANYVTTGSTYMRQLARPRVSPDRLRLIPLGVDTVLFQPKASPSCFDPLQEGGFKLLHVASLIPVKDQAMLLQTLALVISQQPTVHLHIVGDGPLRCDLEKLAKSLGVRHHVTFHGEVPHDQLPNYYRAADVCVLSSRHESQAMVTLEAAACARPTVGTAVGTLADLGPPSVRVRVGDAPALAEAILAALSDPHALDALGRASVEAVNSDYTLQGTVAEFGTLYAELARI